MAEGCGCRRTQTGSCWEQSRAQSSGRNHPWAELSPAAGSAGLPRGPGGSGVLGQTEMVSQGDRLQAQSCRSSRTSAVRGRDGRSTEHSRGVQHSRSSGNEMEQLKAAAGDLGFTVMCFSQKRSQVARWWGGSCGICWSQIEVVGWMGLCWKRRCWALQKHQWAPNWSKRQLSVLLDRQSCTVLPAQDLCTEIQRGWDPLGATPALKRILRSLQ